MNVVVNELLSDLKIINKEFVKEEEITDEIRDKVLKNSDGYTYYFDSDLTEEEIRISLMAHQAKDIKSMKGMMVFFTLLAAASLFLSVIAIL